MDKFLNNSRKRPDTEAAKNQGSERNCPKIKRIGIGYFLKRVNVWNYINTPYINFDSA